MNEDLKQFIVLVEAYLNSKPDENEEINHAESPVVSSDFDTLLSDLIEFKEKLLDSASNSGDDSYDTGFDAAVYQVVEKLENMIKVKYSRTI